MRHEEPHLHGRRSPPADGIIELARNALGSQDERYLRVFKLRGSAYRQGSHAFDSTPDGLKVYPRLVRPVAAASYQRSTNRIPSGVPDLTACSRAAFQRAVPR